MPIHLLASGDVRSTGKRQHFTSVLRDFFLRNCSPDVVSMYNRSAVDANSLESSGVRMC